MLDVASGRANDGIAKRFCALSEDILPSQRQVETATTVRYI